MERETGIEPATSSLGSWRSTAELLPLESGLANVARLPLRGAGHNLGLRPAGCDLVGSHSEPSRRTIERCSTGRPRTGIPTHFFSLLIAILKLRLFGFPNGSSARG